MPTTLAQGADSIIQKLRSAGVAIPGGSRLMNMYTALQQQPDVGHPSYRTCIEAVRDIGLLHFVFDQLGPPQPRTEYFSIVERCVRGATLPEDDGQESVGRNAQAELVIAAICHKGGMTPSFQEPDIVVPLCGQKYGVAVKRIRNLKRLERRFKEAADQLEKFGRTGFIVIDNTEALNGPDSLISMKTSDDDIVAKFGRLMDDLKDAQFDRMKRWLRGRDVLGLVLVHHFPRLHPQRSWQTKSLVAPIPFSPDNARRMKQFRAFDLGFQRGMPGPGNTRVIRASS